MAKAVICDGCGAIFTNSKALKTLIIVDTSTMNDPHGTTKYDLCTICTEKLELWMHILKGKNITRTGGTKDGDPT